MKHDHHPQHGHPPQDHLPPHQHYKSIVKQHTCAEVIVAVRLVALRDQATCMAVFIFIQQLFLDWILGTGEPVQYEAIMPYILKVKSLPSLLFSLKTFAEKVQKSLQQYFATKVRKSSKFQEFCVKRAFLLRIYSV